MKRYIASSRYGYGAIDLYETGDLPENGGNGSCLRTVVSGITQKLSHSLAGELQSAYETGRRDTLADLISTKQIAELAGVSKQAVSNWTTRHEDFPKPAFVVSAKLPVYLRSEVMAWLKANPRHKRTVRQAIVPERF